MGQWLLREKLTIRGEPCFTRAVLSGVVVGNIILGGNITLGGPRRREAPW